MNTTNGSPRETYRKNAISVGILFIIATVVHVLGKTKFLDPILDAPDLLIKVSSNQNQLIIGSLLVLISVFACAGIAIGLYPVLRKHNEALALGSVGFRVMETMLYVIGVACTLSLIPLSQGSASAGAANASPFQISGTLLLAVKDSAGMLSVIAFTMGALLYYYILFRSKLIPRWLSGWGLVAAVSSLACILLTIFGQLVPFSTVFILLQLPIGLQEMVLAVWLIAKGFNQSAIVSAAVKTVTNESFARSIEFTKGEMEGETPFISPLGYICILMDRK